jgi:rhodanese-related sulfurtransferase
MHRTPRLSAAVLAIALALVLHNPAMSQGYPPSVAELVAAAKRQVRTIDMAAFKSAFDRNDLGLIVDVREPEEFAGGYIPGAINVPRGVIELRIWAHVGFPDRTDMSRKMTLYCGSGTRCVLAAKSLQDLGFSNVTAADMRIDDWAKAGHPLVRK